MGGGMRDTAGGLRAVWSWEGCTGVQTCKQPPSRAVNMRAHLGSKLQVNLFQKQKYVCLQVRLARSGAWVQLALLGPGEHHGQPLRPSLFFMTLAPLKSPGQKCCSVFPDFGLSDIFS